MPVRNIKRTNYEVTISESVLTAPGATDPVFVRGGIVFQITGPATASSVVIERSTIDPSSGSNNYAQVDDAALNGNPSTGITAVNYNEPAAAWWRARLVSITGVSVTLSMSGTAA